MTPDQVTDFVFYSHHIQGITVTAEKCEINFTINPHIENITVSVKWVIFVFCKYCSKCVFILMFQELLIQFGLYCVFFNNLIFFVFVVFWERFSVSFSLMFCHSSTSSLVLTAHFPNAGHRGSEGSVNSLCSGRHWALILSDLYPWQWFKL